jgi:hypothetical protein
MITNKLFSLNVESRKVIWFFADRFGIRLEIRKIAKAKNYKLKNKLWI